MSELIVLEELSATEVFKGDGLSEVISKIRTEVTSVIYDVNKKKDRDLMRTNAAKVSKAKTKLDGMGKDLTDEWKAKSKVIDSSRKSMRESMDDLRDEVRAPLTDYENKEKEALAALETFHENIIKLAKTVDAESEQFYTVEQLQSNLEKLSNTVVDESLGKLELACIKAKASGIEKLTRAISDLAAKIQQDKELEELRANQAEQERLANEQRIREEAEERTREEAARAMLKQKRDSENEALRIANESADREAKAKQDQQRAEQQLIDQQAKAEADKIAAIEAEKARQVAEQAQQEKDAADREANKEHKKKINNETMQCFIDGGLSEESAKLAVTLLAKKVIKNAQINY